MNRLPREKCYKCLLVSGMIEEGEDRFVGKLKTNFGEGEVIAQHLCCRSFHRSGFNAMLTLKEGEGGRKTHED